MEADESQEETAIPFTPPNASSSSQPLTGVQGGPVSAYRTPRGPPGPTIPRGISRERVRSTGRLLSFDPTSGGSRVPVPTTLHSVGVSRAWEGDNPSSLTTGAVQIVVSPSSRRKAFPHRLSTGLVVACPTDQCSSFHGLLAHIESPAPRETAPELIAPRPQPMLCRTVYQPASRSCSVKHIRLHQRRTVGRTQT